MRVIVKSSQKGPVLVCTLGGKAQVVTFTIDALLAQNIEISEIIVIHHAPRRPEERLRVALNTLKRELSTTYRNRIRLTDIPIQRGRVSISDLSDASAVSAAYETLRDTIADVKARSRETHFCFTGGRRLLAMQAASLIALHATPTDHVWHLYTPDALRDAATVNKILHHDVNDNLPAPYLVAIPHVPWAYFFRGLRALLGLDPADAARLTDLVQDESELRHCRTLWTRLTPAQRETLALIVEGHSPQDIADTRTVKYRSVYNTIAAIRQEIRIEWGMPESVTPSYDWMIQKFKPSLHRLQEMTG